MWKISLANNARMMYLGDSSRVYPGSFCLLSKKKCYSCIAQGLRDALGFVAKDREGIDVLFFNSACVSFSTRSEMAQKRDFIKHIKNIDIIHNGGFTTQ